MNIVDSTLNSSITVKDANDLFVSHAETTPEVFEIWLNVYTNKLTMSVEQFTLSKPAYLLQRYQ